MSLEIYVPFTLSHVQSILALILSILGVGWFFFLSTAIRYRASRRMEETDAVPVLDTILPLNMLDVFSLLRVKSTTSTMTICSLMILGLALTNFDSIIVVNTIDYVESCKTNIVRTQGVLTVDTFQVAVASYAETDALLQKRRNSGVPSGTLVGQLPDDPRWVFDAEYDVDPYPWRSSCSIYALDTINVNMNTSIMYHNLFQASDLRELVPEVHAEFQFRNSPDGYNYTQEFFRSYVHFNKSSIDAIERTATGSLTLIIEEFRRGNTSLVGSGVINRLWTLRVPEEVRMPYHLDNTNANANNQTAITEVVSVPMFVKAYTCEVLRVKEGFAGSVNLNGPIDVALNVAGELIGRRYLTAQIKGTDDTILEYSPEYWASYIEVRDTMTSNGTMIDARISLPCISIHSLYILLVSAYSSLIIIGIIFWLRLYKNLPNGVVGWATYACKESNLTVITDAEFRKADWEIKIYPISKEQPPMPPQQDQLQQDYQQYPNPQIYYTSDKIEAGRRSLASQASSQHYYNESNIGSTPPNL